ncbi:MAG: polyphosphate kinase 2 family protein [Victivallales bacterium]|jgi:PPK2 family polyphosphate:nucleotide phosphotransferase|nr:polyphosphate kinase 2 family protein [Victivallales bacterium]
MDFRKEFFAKPGKEFKLAEIDADKTFGVDKSDKTLKETAANSAELAELQYQLYSEGKRSLLIVLQGMDAAGKDGVINHVLAPLNPQGCRVQSFKTPSSLELSHDFLWRVHAAAPKKGEIVIFNRSHYEDVLIQRVHNLVPKSVWSERYELINDFEKLLTKNGTKIVKFYLHITPEEQLARFKDRLDDPERQWKISAADYSERKLWGQYQKAFEEVFERCSCEKAPWYIIPANKKYFRNYAISRILIDTLREMKLQLPPVSVDISVVKSEYKNAEQWEKSGLGPDGNPLKKQA